MKKKLAITTMTILLAAGLLPYPSVGFAHGQHGWRNCDRGSARVERPNRGRWMAQILGLSDEQQQQIKQIRQEERGKMKPLVLSLREKRQQLRTAASSETFNEKQIRALAQEEAATQTELEIIRARMHHRIQTVLTPEQRELAKRIRPLFAKRHGRRGNPALMLQKEAPKS
ncbi:MAG: Spy/CpxP family protein refolding chaperone [Deltaproteobacteria bacterium]|jgi:protein CpxP